MMLNIEPVQSIAGRFWRNVNLVSQRGDKLGELLTSRINDDVDVVRRSVLAVKTAGVRAYYHKKYTGRLQPSSDQVQEVGLGHN